MTPTSPTPGLPLAGVRVLELGQLLAGPFAGTLLAYFGAEVVKVEPPGAGDPIRGWRLLDENGTSYWWRSLGRNKLCVTADLRQDEGRALVRRLAGSCRVLIENFRPGTMERWGLGPEELAATNPRLIYARVSGYGQSGPYAALPGYASVCEAVGGLRYLTGHPGEPPVRSNLSLGDTLAGIHAAFGILLALLGQRDTGASGQVVDVALYESVFNCLEAAIPELSGAGVVRGPSGTTITGVVPTNLYRCRDGHHVVIGGTGEAIFRRLMEAISRSDLAADPRLATNAGRVEHQSEVDAAIAAWTGAREASAVLATLAAAAVPAGPVNRANDMVADPHFQARALFEGVTVNGRPLTLPALLPRLVGTPGRTTWPGPEVGAHNREVWGRWLGLGEEELRKLAERGVI